MAQTSAGLGKGDANFWHLENVFRCAPDFCTNSTVSMTVLPAFNRFDVSNGAHVDDLLAIVLAGVVPSHPYIGNADL